MSKTFISNWISDANPAVRNSIIMLFVKKISEEAKEGQRIVLKSKEKLWNDEHTLYKFKVKVEFIDV